MFTILPKFVEYMHFPQLDKRILNWEKNSIKGLWFGFVSNIFHSFLTSFLTIYICSYVSISGYKQKNLFLFFEFSKGTFLYTYTYLK